MLPTVMTDASEKGLLRTIGKTILWKSLTAKTRNLSSIKYVMEDETFVVCTNRMASFDLLQKMSWVRHDFDME